MKNSCIKQFLLSAFISFIFVYIAFCGDDIPLIAKYDGGKVDEAEINMYAAFTKCPDPKPFSTYKAATDEATKKEADFFLKALVDEYIWNGYNAKIAKEKGIKIKPEHQNIIDSTYKVCLSEKWKSRYLDEVTTVSQDKLLADFDKYRDQFEQAEAREVSYIVMFTSDTMTLAQKEEIKQQLEDIRSDIIKSKIKFNDAAMRYSEAPSAKKGGNIGMVKKDDKYNKRFIDLAFSVPEKSLSPVTLLHNGYYLIQVSVIIPEKKYSRNDILNSPVMQKSLLNIAKNEHILLILDELKKKYPSSGSDKELFYHDAKAHNFSCDDCNLTKEIMENYFYARTLLGEGLMEKLTPSEQEITEYYNKNESEMLEEGQWQLTKFIIPVSGEKGSGANTRDEAEKIALKVREDLKNGVKEEEVIKIYSKYNLQASKDDKWVMGSGHAPADYEILKMNVKEFTSVFIDSEGAFFFRFDNKRKPAKLPLRKKKEYIELNLKAQKFEKQFREDKEKLMKKLNVNYLWK